jgi:membrane protease YdiL (CAAX protease family)
MPEDAHPEKAEFLSISEPPIAPALEPTPVVAPGLENALLLPEPKPKPRGIAPLWHTLLLVAAILGFSYWGADRKNPIDVVPVPHAADKTPATKTPVEEKAPRTSSVRLIRYGLSGALELALVGWVAIGVRLRGIPFRSLFGALPKDLNHVTMELGIAAVFWILAMVILGTFALTWNAVSGRVYQHQLKSQQATSTGSTDHTASAPQAASKAPAPKSPKQQQKEMIGKLMELAPATGVEIASWALLCLLVGFSEELIFRGYLQLQGIAFLRGVPMGVVFCALVFGFAHGYQGLRGICLITIYGGLFSGITLLRRSLFPGIVAHSWHDFFTGMLLAFIRSTHLLDKLQS